MKGKIVSACAVLFAVMMLFGAENALAGVELIDSGEEWELWEGGDLVLDPDIEMYYNNREDVPWYDYMEDIRWLTIPSGITWIGNYAFNDAVNLRWVSLPEGFEKIKVRSFSCCKSLESITFPESLSSIDYWAFAECENLKEIVIGGQITDLDNYAFQSCTGLLRAVILEPVERLGYDVLENCTSLKELYLPATLSLIDRYALNNCPALTDIYFAGSEAEWQAVQVEENNDILSQVTVHYDTPYDPEAADTAEADTEADIYDADLAETGGFYEKDEWVRIWGSLQLDYADEEYFVFANGLLDGEEERIAAAGTDRETLDEFFSHNECLIFPTQFSYSDRKYSCFVKCANTSFEPSYDMKALREEEGEGLASYLELFRNKMDLPETEYRTVGDLDYAYYDYEHSDGHFHDYFTILDGNLFAIFIKYEDGYEQEAAAFEEDIMSSLHHYTGEEETALQGTGEAAGSKEAEDETDIGSYTVMDGHITVYLDRNAFDVFLQDNSDNQEALEHQGVTRAQMDLYMNGVGYDIMGVPCDQSIKDCDWRFILHVKDPAYEGIDNLKNLGEIEKGMLGDTLAASFAIDDYELYQTEDVDYIVFEALNSLRYATIIDGRMIYIYIHMDHGSVTDSERELLRSIIDRIDWNL